MNKTRSKLPCQHCLLVWLGVCHPPSLGKAVPGQDLKSPWGRH